MNIRGVVTIMLIAAALAAMLYVSLGTGGRMPAPAGAPKIILWP